MTRKMWFVILGTLGILMLPGGPLRAASPEVNPAAAANLLQIDRNDRILGSRDAPITIVEYASMTCPHCAHFATEVLPELKKKWIDTGKAKLILRDFPLDEPALRASMIARCAPPDRFYAFVDTFFEEQQRWVSSSDYQVVLARLAALGGMSKDRFDACLKDSALENQIVQGRLVASKDLGVDATPTFFINGSKYSGAPTTEDFDKALSALPPKS